MARKWKLRTWSYWGAKKQLCKDRLLKKVLFLKGAQKVGNQDLEAPGAQKQLCNDRLFKKCCFGRVARKWKIRTWRHQGAEKQPCKDKLF